MNNITQLSLLPRAQLLKEFRESLLTGERQTAYAIAMQYRIIDLEYELQSTLKKLEFFQQEWENSQKPGFDELATESKYHPLVCQQ